MAGLGAQYENNVLDAILGPGFSKPAGVYVALYTVAPTAAGGGTEVVGGGYARVATNNDTTTWPAAANGQKSNGVILAFPTATAAWGTVVAFALLDAPSGGTLMCFGNLGTSKSVAAGETPQFAANSLVITAS